MRKSVKWTWNDEQKNEKKKLFDLLTTAPIWSSPNFQYPLQLETDASDTGLNAVVYQKIDEKQVVPMEAKIWVKRKENTQPRKKSVLRW